MKINQTNLDAFTASFERHLAEAIKNHPADYMPGANATLITAKMKPAFADGTFNKDGRAVKAACKELNIPHSYKAIKQFLTCESVSS